MITEELKQYVEEQLNIAVPVGSIHCFATTKIPENFLPCDGRELLVTQYKELHGLIGNTFGGGDKTFCLPDLQGQFIRGWDKEGNIDPERIIGSEQEDSLQGHSHDVECRSTKTDVSGNHSHKLHREEHGGGMGITFYSYNKEPYCSSTEYTEDYISGGYHAHSFTADVSVLGVDTQKFGTVRVSTETRPKNIALLYCIKVK